MREALTSFYFPHDTAASHDPKLITLRVQFGYKAIGMYWNIIEALHRESEGKMPRNQLHAMVQDFFQQEAAATHLMQGEDPALFEAALFNTNVLREDEKGMVYSTRVLSNLAERKEKSEKAKAAINTRWKKENGEQKPKEYGRNTETDTDVILERKGKDSKEKEIIKPSEKTTATTNDDRREEIKKWDDTDVLKLEKEFMPFAIAHSDEGYAQKTWEQRTNLRADNRAEFYRKCVLFCGYCRGRSEKMQGKAKVLFAEIAGFVNDRGAMERRLDDKEILKRNEFAEGADLNSSEDIF